MKQEKYTAHGLRLNLLLLPLHSHKEQIYFLKFPQLLNWSIFLYTQYFNFICLFILAALGVCCCTRALSSLWSSGCPSWWVLSLQSTGSRVCRPQWLWHEGLAAPPTCPIFLDQGWNPWPLHWQADSLLLDHQLSPSIFFSLLILQNKGFELVSFFFFFALIPN